MKFLDRKEQVLELDLTQYGKSLLSRGKFKPVYYAFFDDDIIYDGEYASISEASTQSSDRIKSSVRPEPQTNYAGVETHISKLSKFDSSKGEEEMSLEDKLEVLAAPPSPIDNYYSNGLPLGTSGPNSGKVPAWDLKLLNGEITGSISNYTGSSGLLKIPQLDVEAVYELEYKFDNSGEGPPQDSDEIASFPDGSYIQIKKDFILIDFKEHNSLFEKENFDIEVFEITEEPTSNEIKETLNPLYFIEGKKVINDIYYSEGDQKKIEVTTENVEYYFDLRVDEEIGEIVDKQQPNNIYDKTPQTSEEPC